MSPRDFIHLRYLKMDIHLHGQVECSSGLLRLVSLLEVTPLLEEMELHVSKMFSCTICLGFSHSWWEV